MGQREETPPTSRISLRDQRQIVAALRVVALCFKSYCMYIHHIAPEQKFTPPPGLPANAVPASSLSQEQQSIECVNKSVCACFCMGACMCMLVRARFSVYVFLVILYFCSPVIQAEQPACVFVCMHMHTHMTHAIWCSTPSYFYLL